MQTIINPDSPREEELSPFKVHSRREILALLRSLEQQRQLITLTVNGSAEAVITSVVGVDEDTGTLYIDCATDPAMNRRVTESENLSFETVLDRIRIMFFAGEAKQCTYGEHPALAVPIPEFIIRLQRREHYRVPTPITNPVRCTIPIQHELGTETVTLILQNVSGGGIALVDEKKSLDPTFGTVYRDCKIHLPGNTVVVTALQVRNCQDITLPTGKSVRRIGCLFIELPPAMLSAIQRYITKLEREQNAKRAGMMT
ncbi:c-di-GMP-binding flagellar brake protein YcgR [Paucimonas lemoignei]|uniref:Flagellar brake protein YcgR n=1 Tax=Paucimonas lemoignei TaxID=29443 RepID=A0A4R3I0X4_PAULE|nr:flagellar brake protein [Paucimonas lemoignei]TCS39188.1 c-di-GMP-binding flagellar brake protein YcgR [Paucimonas lemoignei]